MNKINLIISLLLILISGIAKAQEPVNSQTIPDSLKANAYSVVRLNTIDYTYHNSNSAEQQNTYIVTVMNDKGNSAAYFICYCDKFKEMKNFSGELYDANGCLLRKIKQSEVKFTEYSSGLASDGKTYYYECNAPSYPYTVKYKWETKYQKGIIGFPVFSPVNEYNQSVEKASYSILLPTNIEFKHKAINIPDSVYQIENNNKGIKYSWSLNGIPALEKEPFSPDIQERIPAVYATPISFSFDGSEGNLSDWKTFGDWQYKLLENRGILPQERIEYFQNLVKDAATDQEKVKLIYDYLAQNTRYVSIQLGIGGLQPIEASKVCATGFGDCKGLTNYMSAILKALGIPSCYTVISTDNPNIIKDFASANQMNHVILQVPLPNDTLWLECTNMELPFGYIHNSIAGHNALLVKATGGEICRLPTYPDSLNIENNNIAITLSEDGNTSAKVTNESYLFQYEAKLSFTKLSPLEQTDYLRARVNLPQAQITDIRFKENKTSNPNICINYQMESKQYGNKTNNRLFLPVNAFRKGFGKLSNNKRKNNIFIRYGYKDVDKITITLPSNYTVEALPKPIFLKDDYGTFFSLVTIKDSVITITQNLQLNSGEYDVSKYPDFVRFCTAVDNGYHAKLVLKKTEE